MLAPLNKSQRYTFYFANEITRFNGERKFRANFIDILVNNHGNTIRVNNYSDSGQNNNPECIHTFPLYFIQSVETIEDVTNYKSVLPEEVMIIIDGFIP